MILLTFPNYTPWHHYTRCWKFIFKQSLNTIRKSTKLIELLSLTLCFCSTGIVKLAFAEPQEYPTQVSTDGSTTWELKSCARKPNNVISCILSLSSSEDRGYNIYTNNGTKLVDIEGYEYYVNKAQVLKGVVGHDAQLSFNMVRGSQYKATIDFSDVPTSVLYATSLRVGTNYFSDRGSVNFRNVPFINPDGSIPTVPRSSNRPVNPQQQTPATNPPSIIPRICLPFIRCTK